MFPAGSRRIRSEDGALGVKITDREMQQSAGMLIVGQAEPRKWKPNETYFLQAMGGHEREPHAPTFAGAAHGSVG